jgi:hypothetical protein
LAVVVRLKAQPSLFITSNRCIPLRVFEKRMLRRIFGPKRDEVTNETKNTA